MLPYGKNVGLGLARVEGICNPVVEYLNCAAAEQAVNSKTVNHAVWNTQHTHIKAMQDSRNRGPRSRTGDGSMLRGYQGICT